MFDRVEPQSALVARAELELHAARLFHTEGRVDAALERATACLERLAARRESAASRMRQRCVSARAWYLQAKGDFEAALAEHRRALALAQQDGLSGSRIGSAKLGIASSLLAEREFAEGLVVATEALFVLEQARGPGHSALAQAHAVLSFAATETGDAPGAIAHAEAALSIVEHVFGERHPSMTHALSTLAAALARGGRLDQAVSVSHRAVTHAVESLGSHHLVVAMELHNLGVTLARAGRRREAHRALRESLEIRERHLPPASPLLVSARRSLNATADHALGEGAPDE